MVKTKKFVGKGKIHRFYVPFVVEERQVLSDSGVQSTELHISGIAINETTTRNGHVFLAAELEPSAKSLSNKPLLKDHDNSVDSIVGRTGECYYDASNHCIMFSAKVMDPIMREKIKQGLVTSVSVGALVQDAERQESEEGFETYIMRGIEFVELSLVAIPADPNAGLQMALAESFTEVDETINTNEVKLMSDMKEQIAELVSQKEKLTLELEQLAVEKLTLAKEKAIAENASLKVKPTQEATTAPSQTKGQVAETTATDSKLPYNVVESDFGSVGLELDYTRFTSQRLTRGN